MAEEDDDNFNDLMFNINQPERLEVASVSDDSNIGSSVSNFGIDRNNPLENQRYIRENQDPQAIVQGIGIAELNIDEIVEHESGLASSISRTRSSEFIPEIINYETEFVHEGETDSEVGIEESSQISFENFDDSNTSPFDLAIERGLYHQAKIYYDDALLNGSKLDTKFIKSEESNESEMLALRDALIYMLQSDSTVYLEYIDKNVFKIMPYCYNKPNEEKIKIQMREETTNIIKAFRESFESFLTKVSIIYSEDQADECATDCESIEYTDRNENDSEGTMDVDNLSVDTDTTDVPAS